MARLSCHSLKSGKNTCSGWQRPKRLMVDVARRAVMEGLQEELKDMHSAWQIPVGRGMDTVTSRDKGRTDHFPPICHQLEFRANVRYTTIHAGVRVTPFGPASSYRRFFQRLRAGVRGGGVWAAVEGGCRHGCQQAGASEALDRSPSRVGSARHLPQVHAHAQHDAFAHAGLRPRRSHPGGQWATIMRRLVQERFVRILLDEAPPSLLAMRTEFALALPLHPHLDKVARLQ